MATASKEGKAPAPDDRGKATTLRKLRSVRDSCGRIVANVGVLTTQETQTIVGLMSRMQDEISNIAQSGSSD